MPPANWHIIGRQQFDLSLPDRQEAYALQQRVGRLYWDKVVPALEQLFDRLAGPELLVEIEHLEIDLGKVNLHNLDKELEIKILYRLEEAMRKEIGSGAVSATRRHVRLGRFEQWLFYLENGYLPWNSPSGQPEAEWHTAVIETLALQAPAVEQLSRLLRRSATARQRLLRQYPDDFWVKLIEAFTGKRQVKLLAFQQRLVQFLSAPENRQAKAALFRQAYRPVFTAGFSPPAFRQAFWGQALEAVILAGRQLDWKQLALQITQSLFDAAAASAAWPLFEKDNREDNAGKQMKAVFRRFLQAEGIEPASGSLPQQPPEASPGREPEQPEGAEGLISEPTSAPPPDAPFPERHEEGRLDSPGRSAKLRETAEEPEPEDSTTVPEADKKAKAPEANSRIEGRGPKGKEGKTPTEAGARPSDASENPPADLPEGTALFVHYAGLILLNPYLPPFFRELGLLKDNQFTDEGAQQRAVHLLQFLATGETGLPEYEMLLPKFLCGIPFGLPIEREIEATETEREEATHLLTTVIRHWGALGSASPDGLREGFLQRDGKLEKRPNGWYLSVEQKTIDILLDQLPWSISMFQLPWMPEVLRVEWV